MLLPLPSILSSSWEVLISANHSRLFTAIAILPFKKQLSATSVLRNMHALF